MRLLPTLLCCLAVSVTASAAFADASKPSTIVVSGTGAAAAAPDQAILTLAVSRDAKTAREALDANNAAMAEVLKAMKGAGIAERDLQTSGFNIIPNYFHPKPDKSGQHKPPQIIGYVVNNSVTVRVRKLKRLGEVIDTAVTLGVNSGGNIQFTREKPEPFIEQARKNAMANAITKARTLTEAAGVSLGKIMEISEQGRNNIRTRTLARTMAAEASPRSVPIAGGENSYSVTVNVRWEIAQ